MRLVLVGSNPSRASEGQQAFCKSTKSRRTIDSWFDGMAIELIFENVVDYTTENNRPLKVSEIRQAIPRLKSLLADEKKVLALGSAAAKALDMAGIPHLKVPHPSGLNRFWNDPKSAQTMVETIRSYSRQ